MYIAEIKGKLSPRLENMEDILTSNVFSFFKYADRLVFLHGYLRELGIDIKTDDVTETVFEFWPRYEDYTEPDVVIQTREYYILVEAKYFSDFSGETTKTKAQLIREIENGIGHARTLGKTFKLLAITADSYEKPERLATLPEQFIPLCRWTNWQSVARYLKHILEINEAIRFEDAIFARDLYELLDKKNLRSFIGLQESIIIRGVLEHCDQVFFEARTAKHRGDFIGFQESLSTIAVIIQIPLCIFFDRRKRLFQPYDYPTLPRQISEEIFIWRKDAS